MRATRPQSVVLPAMSKPLPAPSPYLTTQEAAAFLRLSPRTLEDKRIDKTGPPYSKLGDSRRAKVVYQEADLIAWVAKHKTNA
jgi:predicted DNA-binding transcriptional regulator AlpA